MDDISTIQQEIENNFKKAVCNSKNIRNAYLLVKSEKLGININIAEGMTSGIKANPNQANHMASVGKLFTATIIGILHDQAQIRFDDKIEKYLDNKIINNLNIYKGTDFSHDITIKHLLTQTSGLNDVFYPLLKLIISDPDFNITPKKAIEWGKINLKPIGKPGQRHFYTDTNYYLLGLIIENITNQPFHEVVSKMIFQPLKMKNAYVNGFSNPEISPLYPPADIYLYNINFINNVRTAQIDYSGGSIVAPLNEYFIFMNALVNFKLVKSNTLNKMIDDDIKMGFPAVGFNYGYSIWKPKTIPLILPKDFYCWGCVGVTGAFMFFHPKSETYIIGNFNDKSFTSKALNFMFKKVIKPLLSYC